MDAHYTRRVMEMKEEDEKREEKVDHMWSRIGWDEEEWVEWGVEIERWEIHCLERDRERENGEVIGEREEREKTLEGGGTYSTAPLDLPCNAPSVDGDDDDDESDEIIIRDDKGMKR